MTSIWIWAVDVVATDVDVTGFDVEATDGHIGKVDATTYDPGTAGLVVDTGFWIFGKKRLLPAGIVTDVDPDEKRVSLSISKDDVKHAPDYDEARAPNDQHDEIRGYFSSDKYRGLHGDPNGPTAGPG